jgi:hypothetical protein
VQNFLYQTTSDSQAFDAYKLYIALKNHFTSNTYDYFKHNGRVKASRKTFDSRNDKYFFYKLAERKDKVEYMVANFVYGSNNWIGDLVNNEQSDKMYREFIKYRDSFTYMLSSDLDKLDPVFDNNFTTEEGQHPLLLKLFLRGTIRLETMVVLDSLINYTRSWNKKISDPVVWPEVYRKIKKYKPFVNFDQQKVKKLVVDKFTV